MLIEVYKHDQRKETNLPNPKSPFAVPLACLCAYFLPLLLGAFFCSQNSLQFQAIKASKNLDGNVRICYK